MKQCSTKIYKGKDNYTPIPCFCSFSPMLPFVVTDAKSPVPDLPNLYPCLNKCEYTRIQAYHRCNAYSHCNRIMLHMLLVTCFLSLSNQSGIFLICKVYTQVISKCEYLCVCVCVCIVSPSLVITFTYTILVGWIYHKYLDKCWKIVYVYVCVGLA